MVSLRTLGTFPKSGDVCLRRGHILPYMSIKDRSLTELPSGICAKKIIVRIDGITPAFVRSNATNSPKFITTFVTFKYHFPIIFIG